MESCQSYLSASASGDLVQDNVIFSDEKLFRCGKDGSGSGQNKRIWKPQSLKKSDVDDPRLYRESETWGKSAMVAMRAMGRGLIGPLFVEKGCKIDGAYYKESILSQDIPQARAPFPEGKWVLQQDCAPAHRKKDVIEWVAKKGAKTLPKWPPTSPDLNVCDYFLWSVMQKYVDDQNPKDEEELQTAIIGAAKSLTQDKITRAIRQFPRRLELCIKAGGGRFEHRKKSPGDIDTLADGPGAVE